MEHNIPLITTLAAGFGIALIFGVIAERLRVPALVGYLVLKDRGPFVRAHAATALNFQLTLLIAQVVAGILWLILVGIVLTMAPPHSAYWPSTTFGFTLKILSHSPK